MQSIWYKFKAYNNTFKRQKVITVPIKVLVCNNFEWKIKDYKLSITLPMKLFIQATAFIF